jgi:pimeloyl-ACP methyl ester carboxylesterase
MTMGSKPKVRGILFRGLLLALVAAVLFYVGACVLVFALQRKLLYLPVIRTSAQVDQLAREKNMERWTNSAGQFIGMKRMDTNEPAEGCVLMFYGNASSAVHCSVYADVIQRVAPLDFYVLEYPGYDDRPGAPSRESLLAAAKDALQALGTNRPIYLVGESLGSGVAAFIAGEFPGKISGLMLLSPYHRLADVAQTHYPWLPARWLMQDDFWSENYLRNYHGRVGVMIDGMDEVVPAIFGHRLFDGYAGPKKLWEYADCHHVQLGESPETFWKAVTAFWFAKKNPPS